jgi:prepilin-type N-terminal cleavage/methylation domain-containing protein
MFKWIRESLNKDEGFTLVELMVVVLIIAILIAIAIPTFLGARQRAQDRAAQSNLRNALTAEKASPSPTSPLWNRASPGRWPHRPT